MNNKLTLDDVRFKVLLHHFSHELGIVPIDDQLKWCDIVKRLEFLPPDEARAMKRKWRKLWRKLARRAEVHAKSSREKASVRSRLGLNLDEGQAPTARQCAGRKSLVLQYLISGLVEPAVQKLDNEDKR